MDMEFADLYIFLISLLIGALIGTERQRRLIEEGRSGVAGLRTYTLISLLGTLCAVLAEKYDVTFIVVAFGAFCILVAVGFSMSVHSISTLDFTSAIAALITFILGALCSFDDQILLALSLAILVTWILATRKLTHGWVEGINDTELLDSLKMGIIALVILPLLPDRTLDPFDVLNPRSIWLMVVLVTLISYVGYVLIKILGENRGLTLTGFLGGLVSSTAVTTTMAAEVKSNKALLPSAVLATAIASCTMFPRILLIILVVNRSLFLPLAAPMISMTVCGIVLAYLPYKRMGKTTKTTVEHQDPFRIIPALKFGAFFAFILVISKMASTYFGDTGIYAASIIAGLADVDAISLSMATLAGSIIANPIAVTSITLAAITNTLVKLSITYVLGTKEFGHNVAKIFVPMIIVGLIAAVAL